MNSYENILTILLVVSVLSLILNFIMFSKLTEMRVHLNQVHASMGSILTRILGLEQLTSKLSIGFTEFMNSFEDVLDHITMPGLHGSSSQLFRTTDGKYTATSLEDLVEKIKKDGKSSEYFKDEDMDNFRSLFEDDEDEEDFLKGE